MNFAELSSRVCTSSSSTLFNTDTVQIRATLILFHFSSFLFVLRFNVYSHFIWYFPHSFSLSIWFIYPSVYVFYQFSPFLQVRLFSLICVLFSSLLRIFVFLCLVYEAIKWIVERHHTFLSGKMSEYSFYETKQTDNQKRCIHIYN